MRTPSSAEPLSACRAVAARASSTAFSPSSAGTGTTRDAGATRCEAAPPCTHRTESPKHFAPGTNTCVPIAIPASRASLDNPADALVAGDERIAHPGKCGHPAVEQQALGAGADAAPAASRPSRRRLPARPAGAAPAPRASAAPKPLPANSACQTSLMNLMCQSKRSLISCQVKFTHVAQQRR